MEKRYRLRNNRDFQYTYKKGRSVGHPLLVLVYRRTNQAASRVGFSITKKFGKAVKRNRIKRQLREIVRTRYPDIRKGYDIIFTVRKDAKGAPYKELEQAVDSLLRRGKLYREGDSSL